MSEKYEIKEVSKHTCAVLDSSDKRVVFLGHGSLLAIAREQCEKFIAQAATRAKNALDIGPL